MKKIFNFLKDSIRNYRPPKFIILFIFLIIFIFVYFKNMPLDNDSWFLLNHGRYVFEHGIPHVEPFTIHSGFKFVMQQWLSSSIFWFVYKYLGSIGIRFLVLGVFALINYIFYKLCMLLSKNKVYLTSLCTIVFSIILAIFMVSRPQIFTYLILLSEIYILELYIRNKNKKILILLPILSILEINLHASMWFMLFLFFIPYLIDSFNINLTILKTDGYEKKYLFIIFFVMLLVGFINPYGIDSITYVFNSYGIEQINEIVGEMQYLSLSNFVGIVGFLIIFGLLYIYFFYKKKSLKLRYYLLFSGTAILGIMQVRSFPLFIIVSIFPICELLSDEFKKNKFNVINSKKLRYIYAFLFICLFVFASSIFKSTFKELDENLISLKNCVSYLDSHYKTKDLKIYTNYNDGNYFEFNNYKTYIDTRAEVFLKSNNKKEDVFNEYYNLSLGALDINEFTKKYKFDVLVISNIENIAGKKINNYNKVYEDKYRSMYEIKKN